ncbi:GNAT family N-acetyltransferase [Streptodolium elevatio]|uniref:GNAT family N-acetyltransferase n=1 Tax=Streptodolium elevatio TaxID=3157996 RepID=A0ABV3DG85_9ACTN
MDDHTLVPDAVPGPSPLVRRARPHDLPRIVELMREHTAYEKAAPPTADVADRLGPLLFGTAAPPRLHCVVAELAGGEVVGYATCAAEMSTWDAREYLHMDCLFLRDGSRGHGLGRQLLDAVVAVARELGLTEVQWQTPVWNEGAVRFYNRLGGGAKEKLRYTLPVPPIG